jgi:hypothetical protein
MRQQRPTSDAETRRIVVSSNQVKTMRYECPVCRARIDGASCVTDPEPMQPTPGCLSVCAFCASILVYTETNLELATEDMVAAFPPDERAILESAVAFIKSTL